MKSRLSYFLISGIIITLVFTAIFIWRNNSPNEIPQPNEKSYSTPISSRYIPKNADLVFHWKINPSILPNYVENSQEKINKKISNKITRLLRDSYLNLISLDFEKDLSKWVGEYGSFALFEDSDNAINDWIIVLKINNSLNDEEALESILIDSNFDNKKGPLDKQYISKSKIISKKINSNQSIYFLKDKEYILIASNPKIIQSSINESEIDILSAKEKYKSIQLKENLNDGVLLIEMSPNKIFNLIDQKTELFEFDKSNKLISSINIDNKQLIFEGILYYDMKRENLGNGLDSDLFYKEKELKSFDDYILIDNPKQYFSETNNDPLQKLVASLITKSTTNDYSHLFKIILENTTGNLIWLKDKEWLALTKKSDTNKKEINNILNRGKYLNSHIDFQNKSLEVWSKLDTVNTEEVELKESIEAIIQETENVYIWSQNLSSISNLDNQEYLENNINSEPSKSEMNDFDDIIKIHLGKEKTEVLLTNFYPYILLRTMLGNKLDFPENIDISLATPRITYSDFVKFKINLKPS